jgi:hypothetical protein
MPEKKRQKKAGQDKGKKNQARRRGGRQQTSNGPGNGVPSPMRRRERNVPT